MAKRSRLGALVAGMGLVLAACGGGGSGEKSAGAEKPSVAEKPSGAEKPSSVETGASGKKVVAGAEDIGLRVAPSTVLHPEGAKNPTTAVDPESGAVYTAYARELPVPQGSEADPLLEAVVARSDDGGKTFSEPVVVSPAGERIVSYTVSPTQVEVGNDGTVYVLYLKNTEMELPGYDYGLSYLQLVKSSDGGTTWSEPVEAASEASEGGVVTSREMATLFVAPDDDLYISFLDVREEIAVALDKKAGKIPMEEEHSGHGEEKPGPETHLRITRSADGGETFSPSVLVSKPTCACCGTKVAEGKGTPLFSTTRSDWKELKGSKDAVRDPFLSWSDDHGATWAEATKIHDDGFKISGCPDVNAGLAVDSQNRLHAAWYTGTDRGPGVYYAVSEDDGETFSEPVALLADEWVPYADVQMVIDDDDRPWVAFEDRRGDVDKVQVVRIDPGGGRTYSKAFTGTAPDLAAHGGEAYVVWATPAAAGDHDKLGPLRFAVLTAAGADEAAAGR